MTAPRTEGAGRETYPLSAALATITPLSGVQHRLDDRPAGWKVSGSDGMSSTSLDMNTNFTLRTAGASTAVAALILTGALQLGGCSASTPSSTLDSSPTSVAEGPDTWTFVLVGRGTEADIDPATGASTEGEQPIDAANERVVRSATAQVQTYLDKAWLQPATTSISSPN